MASNKTKPKENPINAAVSLLQSAEHCQHAHLAVEKIRTIVKDYFPANSAVKRKLDAHLRPLSQALPLISRAVKARATLCAPPKSNPSYARARLQSASTSPTSSGTEKLQALVRDSAPILPTPRKSTRRRKLAVVTPEKRPVLMPADLPIPRDGHRFLLAEAVVAFNEYPHRKFIKNVVRHWESEGWVPKYTMRNWYKLGKMVKEGKPLAEFDDGWFHKNGRAPRKIGRKPYIEVHELRVLVESGANGATFGTKEVVQMIETQAKKRDIQSGHFHNPSGKRACKRTYSNYKTLACTVTDTTITNSAVSKTEVREVAENSIRSTFSYA